MEFDSSMSYMLQRRMDSEKDREAREFIKNSTSRYAAGKSSHDIGTSEDLRSAEYQRPYRWGDSVMGFGHFLSRGRGGRGRGRGRSRGRGQRQVARVSVGMNVKRGQSQVYTRRSRGRGRQKGRRTVRKRQSRFGSKSAGKVVGDTYFEKAVTSMQIDGQESPSNPGGGEEWEGGELYLEGVENDNGGGVYDSDENGQVSGDDDYEDDDQGAEDYTISYNGRRGTLMNESEEDVEDDGNGDEDDDGEGDEGPYDGGDGDEDEDDDGDDDRDEDEVHNVDDDIEGHELDDGEGNGDEDEGTSSSSEYSDN